MLGYGRASEGEDGQREGENEGEGRSVEESVYVVGDR